MSNLNTFLIGATAGVAVTLFFTSSKGKQVIKDLTDRYDDKILELSGALKNKVDETDDMVKDRIDQAADKLIIS